MHSHFADHVAASHLGGYAYAEIYRERSLAILVLYHRLSGISRTTRRPYVGPTFTRANLRTERDLDDAARSPTLRLLDLRAAPNSGCP